MGQDYSTAQMVLGIAIFIAAYFIPNWVASVRHHHNANAIFFLNLLLGWTFIGWVVALVWALTEVKPKDETEKEEIPKSTSTPTEEADTKACPFCAETIKKAAKICRYCGRDLPENTG